MASIATRKRRVAGSRTNSPTDDGPASAHVLEENLPILQRKGRGPKPKAMPEGGDEQQEQGSSSSDEDNPGPPGEPCNGQGDLFGGDTTEEGEEDDDGSSGAVLLEEEDEEAESETATPKAKRTKSSGHAIVVDADLMSSADENSSMERRGQKKNRPSTGKKAPRNRPSTGVKVPRPMHMRPMPPGTSGVSRRRSAPAKASKPNKKASDPFQNSLANLGFSRRIKKK